MSWIQKYNNNLIIRTGDGVEFSVLWKNASRTQEYNVAQFEFPDTDGTLAKRSRPKGMMYNVEIYFQGEFHLDDSLDFKRSADDPRDWTLIHPLYGTLTVTPLTVNFDNETSMNYTKVTASVIETITDVRPRTSIDPKDKILSDHENVNAVFSNSFATDVIPSTSDVANLNSNNDTVYNVGKKKVKLTLDAENYFNAFRNANSKIIEATNDPLDAITALQAVINAPAFFADSVQNRIDLLITQFNTLRVSIPSIISYSQKRIFENNIGALMSAMVVASSQPQEGDYRNRTDVVNVIEKITSSYNTYISDLDSMQSENGASVDSYIPDHGSMQSLADLVDFAISNLFDIAIDGKQERTILLEDDSNAVLLTHRFYGIDEANANLEQFISQNNIGLNEVLSIRKGRKIIYYI